MRLRRARHLWRLRRSGLFDAPWYRANHAADLSPGTDLARHYLRHGAGDPGPRFSGAAYLSANRDVAASGLNPLVHYLLDGWAQGRPLRSEPHETPRLPAAAVLGAAERVRQAVRLFRPRTRTLHPQPGPDVADTILIRPGRGAMPTGWCLISAQPGPALLLALAGGVIRQVDLPAAPVPPRLVLLPVVPAGLALRRPAGSTESRPLITVREIAGWRAGLAFLSGPRSGGSLNAQWSAWKAAHRPEDVSSYAAWVRRYDTPTAAQRDRMADRARRLSNGPVFTIVVAPGGSAREQRALAASLDAQLYPRWRMAPAAGAPTGSNFVAFVGTGAVLAPHALLLLAEAIEADPAADLLYGDSDSLRDGQRDAPWFKPDFSPERQSGQDLFGALGVVRTSLLDASAPDWNRLAQNRRVLHLPHVLVHAPPPRPAASTPPEDLDPVAWPTVTAIVPTRDHASVLRTCLEGLLDGTDYPALDIVVADNDSREAATADTLAWARDRGVAVLPCPGPFNYAAINNRAAEVATGELLLFLNNDISMSDRGWLKHMVRLASGAGVGAVGARLLYPDGMLQHGGVVLGIGGVAGHVHVGAAPDNAGEHDRLRLTQEVSAVTGACMVVPARAFAAVGGFDAVNLAVAFNDVDLCLRLRAAGLRILWTPHAVLHHWESRSRGSDLAPHRRERFAAEVAVMKNRWADTLRSDPFYSPNLSLDTTEPGYAFPPRVPRPWA